MREVIYRNLTSLSLRKKDILLQEVFEKDGVVAKTERRCLYFVKDKFHLDEPGDLQKWVAKQGASGVINKRHFHIFKHHNDSLGVDRFVCKILGNFYIVANEFVYVIAFLQSFKVRFSKQALTG